MSLQIYNTLTRKKEPFETIEPGQVKMYVCGPTVYAEAHVGHGMSAMVFDIARRYLEYRGFSVRYAMNFTDVDDKIIQRANMTGENPFELAEKYIQAYEKNLENLNILPATVNPRATQEIDQIVSIVKELVDRGYAYPTAAGDVYFRVRKDEDYGKLSRRNFDDVRSGTRVAVDEEKEDPLDFALWKAAKPGEPSWESPWGKGRPGWHIECSAMSLHHLGEQIDIHGGGNDLVFPHHENEIAQSESLTGKRFVRYWMHNGMLQLGGEKMSKSLGNLVTIDKFLAEHEANVLRLMVLNSGYRSPLTFTDEVIEQTERALERLRTGLRPASPDAAGADEAAMKTLNEQIEATKETFIASMDDDFNTAGALAALFDLVRTINSARDAGATGKQLQPAQDALKELSGVFGLELERDETGSAQAEPFVDLLLQVRGELRKQKLWALSDQIRDQLTALGVVIEDSRDGSTWRWE